MARQVLSSYRRDDFADPDGYLVQLGMVLERYADGIIRDATSPITGIQRTCKFPPSIAEFVEFCDELQRRATFGERWGAQARKQLSERDEWERQSKEESPEHRAAVVKRIKAELAKQFKFSDAVVVNRKAEEANLEKYGITKEQIESLPPTNAQSHWKQIGEDIP